MDDRRSHEFVVTQLMAWTARHGEAVAVMRGHHDSGSSTTRHEGKPTRQTEEGVTLKWYGEDAEMRTGGDGDGARTRKRRQARWWHREMRRQRFSGEEAAVACCREEEPVMTTSRGGEDAEAPQGGRGRQRRWGAERRRGRQRQSDRAAYGERRRGLRRGDGNGCKKEV